MPDLIFKMRVTPEWLAELDAWRAVKAPKLRRSASVRAMFAMMRDQDTTIAQLREQLHEKGNFW